MWDPTLQNFAQKFLLYAHFSSFSSQFPKISNFPRAINFVLQKRLVYEKASIANGECHEIKIKLFA